jgi:hypothetical protein
MKVNLLAMVATKACNGEPRTCHSIWHFRMAVDYEEISDNPCRKVKSLPENNQRRSMPEAAITNFTFYDCVTHSELD